MASVTVLGKVIPVAFQIGEGGAATIDKAGILASLRTMGELIDRCDWPPHYAKAFRNFDKVVFFTGAVMVDGYLMDRPCCDQDDAIFYWEVEEFEANMDDDVHANTFFHDCWHITQFRDAGNRYAMDQMEQVRREVDAITHQIGVAHMLGCSPAEVGYLEDFRSDQEKIKVRLAEGVGGGPAHPAGQIPGRA